MQAMMLGQNNLLTKEPDYTYSVSGTVSLVSQADPGTTIRTFSNMPIGIYAMKIVGTIRNNSSSTNAASLRFSLSLIPYQSGPNGPINAGQTLYPDYFMNGLVSLGNFNVTLYLRVGTLSTTANTLNVTYNLEISLYKII